uniref:Retrovirus-related Pol polyprotein from transposon TNT 1-94 n=1 Tax=Tanacetum cinerariifolium TaxID=118510 RepID=A0A699JSA6_TANCI|nr:retrovirus-related Pol polyprotein from transposon TNT 1-94 [Tanacetum cinerariifolium]
MKQKIEWLQAQLGDLKGKSKDPSYVLDTQNLLSQKLENKNVEFEFQVLNYARENAHLKATYKNLFDSISVSRAQTKTIISSLQNELQSNIYKNAKLRTQLFKKASDQKDNIQDTSKNTKFVKKPIVENLPKIGKTNALSNPVTSNSVSTPQESKGVNNDKVISPRIFRINPDKTSMEAKKGPNTVRASAKTKPITVSQPHVITKKDVNSDLNGLSSTGIDNTKTRRPQPRSNTKNHRVPFASKRNLKLLINFIWKFMGTVRFGNDHVAAILGFEVAFRRNACFVRNLEGVDLLKGDRSTNLYTINLHEMASALPICLMARASSTKSWLWHQRSKDEAPEVIIKFLKRITVLLQSPVIIIRTDNGTEFKNQVLKEYFDTVGISHQMSSVRTSQQNGVVERRNRTLVEATITMLIFSRAPLFLWAEAIATACFTQNRSIIHRRFNKTPYELINGKKLNISFLHVFGALCYPKNDRKDIVKLGAKGDIGFFIGYSTDSCAYRVYNRRTKKIMETMNVSFDELLAMAFEQCSSKPGLQSMTSGHISLGLDLTYAPSTITTQQPFEGELNLLFEAMYDDYIGGQPSATARTVPPAQEPQVRQTSTASTTIADIAPIPTNSSSLATNVLISS